MVEIKMVERRTRDTAETSAGPFGPRFYLRFLIHGRDAVAIEGRAFGAVRPTEHC